MNTIQFENVDFSYSKKMPLLSDVNLQIKPGHIHGLLGKNGEGKSTLLKLIAGLLFPRKGNVNVMGFEPRKRNPEMLRDIYFLTEELPTYALSIARFEQVYAPFYPNFSSSQFDRYLKEFEIPSKDWKMNKLSYGQKKKIMVAFGLATNTKILLMDEPTNSHRRDYIYRRFILCRAFFPRNPFFHQRQRLFYDSGYAIGKINSRHINHHFLLFWNDVDSLYYRQLAWNSSE
ncbi:hypothetical protein AGMMS50262_11530 [Bacteroidia bacterium]|nr:hypothetical protein AGMMS50262_11530 [Bacteroidia bacterium]